MEPLPSVNHPVNPYAQDPYKTVLPKIFEYVKVQELMRMRRVCKLFNDIIVQSKRINEEGRLFLKVCKDPESVETFKTLSLSLPVAQFHFEELDLDDVFGDAETFRRFSTNHCLKMTSLSINNCNLCTGRFFELLAFCKKLKRLRLRNVPSIYKISNGIAVYDWAFCFKFVRENLAKLQNLTLSENTLNHNDIWGLMNKMTDLKLLHLHVRNIVPITGLNESLKVCHKSLTTLIIRGAILSPGLELAEGIQMENLQKLSLLKCRLHDGTVKQFETFLMKCPQLEMLRLSCCKIEKTTLSSIQENLVSMDLIECNIDADAFQDAQFNRLETLKLELRPEKVIDASAIVKGVGSLLNGRKPQLVSLELKLPSDGALFLKFLQADHCPKLTTLCLHDCSDIAGPSLRKIFKNFTGLLKLSIVNCRDLNDDNVCPLSVNDGQQSLANLKNLKTLDLRETNVGDKTVNECVIVMENLENINLENTKVTKEGLKAIVINAKIKLTSLKAVNVKNCQVSWPEMKKLIYLAPSLSIECHVISNSGPVVEVGLD